MKKILNVLSLITFLYFLLLLIIKIFEKTIFIWLLLSICFKISTYFSKVYFKIFNKILVILLIVNSIILFFIIESSFHKDNFKSDYGIVLGAGLKNNKPSITLKSRLDASINWKKSNPKSKLVLSGGKGKNEAISEAKAMKNYLNSKGISDKEIIIEENSKNTYENLEYSYLKLKKNKKLKITIISSDYHLFRSKKIANKLGMDVYIYSSKTTNILKPHYFLREIIASFKEIISNMV